jgi:hypothetical protein
MVILVTMKPRRKMNCARSLAVQKFGRPLKTRRGVVRTAIAEAAEGRSGSVSCSQSSERALGGCRPRRLFIVVHVPAGSAAVGVAATVAKVGSCAPGKAEGAGAAGAGVAGIVAAAAAWAAAAAKIGAKACCGGADVPS